MASACLSVTAGLSGGHNWIIQSVSCSSGLVCAQPMRHSQLTTTSQLTDKQLTHNWQMFTTDKHQLTHNWQNQKLTNNSLITADIIAFMILSLIGWAFSPLPLLQSLVSLIRSAVMKSCCLLVFSSAQLTTLVLPWINFNLFPWGYAGLWCVAKSSSTRAESFVLPWSVLTKVQSWYWPIASNSW